MNSVNSTSVPNIPPISDDLPRPKWSVMIPVRNRLDFLEQSLRSVLDQAPPKNIMQIEVIDNSNNNLSVQSFVAKIAQDRVNYYKQPAELGMAANWNSCVKRARGHLVHILHDDDFVAPNFYARMGEAADRHKEAGVIACRCFVANQRGELESLHPRIPTYETPSYDVEPIFYTNWLLTPSVVVLREVYERIGGFQESLKYLPDWELWLRAISTCGVIMVNQPLAYYRLHEKSVTAELAYACSDLKEVLALGKSWEKTYSRFDNRRFRKAVLASARETPGQFGSAHKQIKAIRRKYWNTIASPKEKILHGVRALASKLAARLG